MSGNLREHARPFPPDQQDIDLAATASRTLARAKQDRLTVKLDDGSQLTLPAAVTRLLGSILTETANGNSVTVIPMHALLTTQEAANLLNVSRPYLVGLLERGEIDHTKVGSHRRVKVTDVLNFQQGFADRRELAQRELTAQAQELGLDDEPLPLHRIA